MTSKSDPMRLVRILSGEECLYPGKVVETAKPTTPPQEAPDFLFAGLVLIVCLMLLTAAMRRNQPVVRGRN